MKKLRHSWMIVFVEALAIVCLGVEPLSRGQLARADAKAPKLANPFYAMDTAGGSLDMLKELGYTGISGHLYSTKTGTDAKKALDFAREVQDKGLKFFAIYVGNTLTKEGLQINPALEETMAGLKGHGTLIWLYILSRDFKLSSPDGDTLAVPELQRLADVAAKSGLRVAIYPHKGFWAERVQDGVRLAKKVGRPNFGVTFNLCHCLSVGDEDRIGALLTEARPHLFMVTINGADTRGQNWKQFIQPLGQGTFDLAPLLRKLQELGYDGPIGFQGYGITGDRRQLLTQTMAAWKKLAGQ